MVVLYNVLLKWSQWLGDVQSCSRSQCRISGCLFCDRQTTSWISHKTAPPQHIHTQPFNSLFFRDNLGRPVPEETFSNSHPSWSSDILYQLPPFTTIRSNLSDQLRCLTVLFDNLSPGPLWSSSWSWTLNFILHAFLHPIIVFFLQHMPMPSQPVLLYTPHNCNKFSTSRSPLSLGHGLCNYHSG